MVAQIMAADAEVQAQRSTETYKCIREELRAIRKSLESRA
jgi:hypothetical protein